MYKLINDKQLLRLVLKRLQQKHHFYKRWSDFTSEEENDVQIVQKRAPPNLVKYQHLLYFHHLQQVAEPVTFYDLDADNNQQGQSLQHIYDCLKLTKAIGF